MKHILGMAKSSLDLAGAKAQKLELDLLRLVYAVQHLRRRGEDARGYLVVLRPELATRVRVWLRKYEAADCVTCLCHEVDATEAKLLLSEKAGNVAGMLAGADGRQVDGRSSAALGRSIGEAALTRLIQAHEPDIDQAPSSVPRPFAIQWDFYGVRA